MLHVENTTKYRLEMMDLHYTEFTDLRWFADRVEPGPAAPSSCYTSRIQSVNSDHGIAMALTYKVIDPRDNSLVGVVALRAGIDCTTTDAFCADYHRWAVLDCDSGGKVGGNWTDEGGPREYWAHFVIRDFHAQNTCWTGAGQPSTNGPLPAGPSAPPSPDPDAAPGGWPWASWVMTAHLENDSPYELRNRAVWNNEGTHFDGAFGRNPPVKVAPRSHVEPAWAYSNETSGHGVSGWLFYDVVDPATGRWVGSVVFIGASDCKECVPTSFCRSGGNPVVRAVGVSAAGHLLTIDAFASAPKFEPWNPVDAAYVLHGPAVAAPAPEAAPIADAPSADTTEATPVQPVTATPQFTG